MSTWKQAPLDHEDDDDGETAGSDGGSGRNVRLYLCIALFFVLLFTVFCLIVWGASKPYKHKVIVKMKKFTQSRKSKWMTRTVLNGHQVPLHGGVSVLASAGEHLEE